MLDQPHEVLQLQGDKDVIQVLPRSKHVPIPTIYAASVVNMMKTEKTTLSNFTPPMLNMMVNLSIWMGSTISP